MKTKFKLFIFHDIQSIQFEIEDWLKKNDLTILFSNTITFNSEVAKETPRFLHFVYYIENYQKEKRIIPEINHETDIEKIDL